MTIQPLRKFPLPLPFNYIIPPVNAIPNSSLSTARPTLLLSSPGNARNGSLNKRSSQNHTKQTSLSLSSSSSIPPHPRALRHSRSSAVLFSTFHLNGLCLVGDGGRSLVIISIPVSSVIVGGSPFQKKNHGRPLRSYIRPLCSSSSLVINRSYPFSCNDDPGQSSEPTNPSWTADDPPSSPIRAEE